MNRSECAPARAAASELIYKWEKDKAYSDILFREFADGTNMDKRDIALLSRIFYGTIQNLIYIDYIINSISSMKIKKMHPKVRSILRISVYQLLFLDKVPDHAVVNDAVNLTRKNNAAACGLVNAVLHKCISGRDNKSEIKAKSKTEELSILYSHPEWLVKMYMDRVGEKETEMLLKLNNGTPPTQIRINTLKCGPEELKASLREEEAEFTPSGDIDVCGNISAPGSIEQLETYKRGFFTVQDKTSYIAVLLADPKEGEKVLDVCAAPGGKSFAAAARMNNTGSVTACDIYSNKLSLIKSGAERLGIEIIKTVKADAAVHSNNKDKKYDLVICDVPCSGLGIISKKPDIRYKDPQDIAELPVLQTKILSVCAEYVKPGGRIVYSTCTLNRAENEDVILRFLSENSNFEKEDIAMPSGFETNGGELTLWPQRHGCDGFYMCRMKRIR